MLRLTSCNGADNRYSYCHNFGAWWLLQPPAAHSSRAVGYPRLPCPSWHDETSLRLTKAQQQTNYNHQLQQCVHGFDYKPISGAITR